MKTIKFALLAVVVLVLASCEANTYDEIAVQTTNPTYEINIKPIMSANCNNCHSSSGGQSPSLENYAEVKAAVINNNLMEQIEAPSGQGMPENQRMPQSKIDAVKTWTNNGFPK